MKCRVLIGVSAALLGAIASSSSAVELLPDGTRLRPQADPLRHMWVPVGDGTVGFFFGMSREPAFVREANGYELFAYKDVTYDDKGEWAGGTEINEQENPQDKVSMTATVQLLGSENLNAKVLASQDLGSMKLTNAVLGLYAVEFIPNPAGPYAVHLKGSVNGQVYDARLVCSTGEEHTFSCVQYRKPVVF